MPDPNTVNIQVRQVPFGLWRQLRVAAAHRDVPVRELVVKALEEYVSRMGALEQDGA